MKVSFCSARENTGIQCKKKAIPYIPVIDSILRVITLGPHPLCKQWGKYLKNVTYFNNSKCR